MSFENRQMSESDISTFIAFRTDLQEGDDSIFLYKVSFCMVRYTDVNFRMHSLPDRKSVV